jgi:hypothetical protein
VATTCKTPNETRARERSTTLAWEKEKTNAHHLEEQLTATQGIVIPWDDEDDHCVDIVLVAHVHA